MPTYNFRPRRQTFGEQVKQQAIATTPWSQEVKKYLWERPLHGWPGYTLPSGAFGQTALNRKSGWVSLTDPIQTGRHELGHMADYLKKNRKGYTKQLKGIVNAYLEMMPRQYKPSKASLEDIIKLEAPTWLPLLPTMPTGNEIRDYRGTRFPTEDLVSWVTQNYKPSRWAEEVATEAMARGLQGYAPLSSIFQEYFY